MAAGRRLQKQSKRKLLKRKKRQRRKQSRRKKQRLRKRGRLMDDMATIRDFVNIINNIVNADTSHLFRNAGVI